MSRGAGAIGAVSRRRWAPINVPSVVFIHPDGRREVHAVAAGDSVMDCAVDNGVAGIRAQCGGGCTCSTCHAVVDADWFARVGEAVGDERDILAFVPERRCRSRLTCQIVMRDELDGLIVHIVADAPDGSAIAGRGADE